MSLPARNLLEKARRAIESAETLLRHGDADGACSRAYYAMFDAARFALAAKGHDPESIRTHSTVHGKFAEEYVKTGLVPREIGRSLGQIQDIRLLADYASEEIPLEKADWSVCRAKEFVDVVRKLEL